MYAYRSIFHGVLGAVVAVALMLIAPVAGAQESPAASRVIEEIVVTAQKREENLQAVSASVQAITGDGLERAGILDVSKLEQIAPGVVFAKSGNDAKISMRGANSNSTFADNTSIVGVFVDGVYKPRSSQQSRAFFDVERVEILRGPQGTLYGRNTLGGAINLYSKAPEISDEGITFGLTSTYSSFNRFRNEFFVNSSVSDELGLRLAVLTDRSNGWVENRIGRNMGIADALSFRASALWEASDQVSMLLRLTSIAEDGNPAGMFAIAGACRSVTANGLTDPRGTILDCQNPRRGSGGTPSFDSFGSIRTVERDFIHDDRLRESNLTLDVDVDFDSMSLKSITSFTDYESLLGNDSDYSANPHGREWVEENNKSYTQEFQLSSTTDSRLQWTTGLYASEDELFFAYSSLRHTVDDMTVRPMVLSDNGVLLPVLIGTPLVSLDNSINGTFNSTQVIDSRTLGVFAQGSFAITDSLRFIAGARYSDEKKDAQNGNALYVGSLTPRTPPTNPQLAFPWDPATATGRSDTSETFTNTTWRAGVEFDFGDDMMTYANVSTGFLSGVMNQNGSVTLPQESTSYEIGIKSRFMDGRAQLNAAVYRAEYTDLATTFQIPNPNDPSSVITLSSNGGEIDATGLEVSFDVIPVENLYISVAASFMDAEYGVFGQNLPQQVINGIAPTDRFIDLRGERPPYTPEITSSLRVSYDIQFASGVLTPQLQSRYSDSYFATGALPYDIGGFQPSFTQTDLRLTWAAESSVWSAELFAENLEDELTNQRTQHGGDGIQQANYGYPRSYGARLKLSF